MPSSMPLLIAIAIILLYLLNSIKILKEYERGVIFRLGRVRHDATGPGLIFVFRPVDHHRPRLPPPGGHGSPVAGHHHP